MKNKTVASLVLVAAILVLFSGNYHFGRKVSDVLRLPTGNKTLFSSDQKTINIYEEFDHIEQVELNLSRGDLKIVSGNSFSIKGTNVNENDYSCTVNDKTLIIHEKSSANVFTGNSDYILTIPSAALLSKITANYSSGTVKFDDVSAKEASFQVEKGSLEGFHLAVSKLNVDAGMGSVNLHNIRSQSIHLSSGMGSVNMDCKLEGDNGELVVDSPLGSVNIKLDHNPADFYFDLAKRSSSVNIDGVKATSYKYYKNDKIAGKYDLIIGLGSVEICFNNPSGT